MLNRRILIVAAVGLFSSAIHADTIYVDAANCPGPGDGSVGDPYCSIQTAGDNAVDTDEIVITPGPSELCNVIALPRKLMASTYVPGATTISAASTTLSTPVGIEQSGSPTEPPPGPGPWADPP